MKIKDRWESFRYHLLQHYWVVHFLLLIKLRSVMVMLKEQPQSLYGAVGGLIAFLIIGFAVSWWGAIGVWIFIWANNMEQSCSEQSGNRLHYEE